MVSDINRYTTANSLMLPIFSKLSIASSQKKKKSLKFSKILHYYSFSNLVLVLIFAWKRFITFIYFPFSFPFPFFLIKKEKKKKLNFIQHLFPRLSSECLCTGKYSSLLLLTFATSPLTLHLVFKLHQVRAWLNTYPRCFYL